MGLLDGISPRALLSSALLLSSLAQDVLARPSPKVGWVRNGPGKKKMLHDIKRAAGGNGKGKGNGKNKEPACIQKGYGIIDAPKPNVWGELTGPETESLIEWMLAQPDLNLTLSEEAGSWDNSM